jgi:hypothetical protein
MLGLADGLVEGLDLAGDRLARAPARDKDGDAGGGKAELFLMGEEGDMQGLSGKGIDLGQPSGGEKRGTGGERFFFGLRLEFMDMIFEHAPGGEPRAILLEELGSVALGEIEGLGDSLDAVIQALIQEGEMAFLEGGIVKIEW